MSFVLGAVVLWANIAFFCVTRELLHRLPLFREQHVTADVSISGPWSFLSLVLRLNSICVLRREHQNCLGPSLTVSVSNMFEYIEETIYALFPVSPQRFFFSVCPTMWLNLLKALSNLEIEAFQLFRVLEEGKRDS